MRASDPAGPRPLSGGLWTLLSWLRRPEHASSDSLSSAGSARTAASFAFLQPPRCAAAAPAALAPPTDTYRKRVRDRNLRRQYDRDLTLRRKYGLFREGYDAFSLPLANRKQVEVSDRQERDKRAASEGSPRREHVPGKRRAPPPPQPPPVAGSLTRRRTRKRPAPQPPATSITMNQSIPQKENKINDTCNVNPSSSSDVRPQSTNEYHYILDCKLEKYSKKEQDSKESKPRVEKSFIKQLFENKKRNSAIETRKILPNISELDKQAAEIIESCKLKPLEQQNNFIKNNASPSSSTWFCTMCLRKYDSSVVTCRNCLPDKTKVSLHTTFGTADITESGPPRVISKKKTKEISGEEKQKLKEMLKEMKDSLPKKQKSVNCDGANGQKSDGNKLITENIDPATLKIGFSPQKSNVKVTQLPFMNPVASEGKTSKVFTEESRNQPILHSMAENVVVTQPVVLVAPQLHSNECKNDLEKKSSDSAIFKESGISENHKPNGLIHHTPLKLSSLLNPVYIPKDNDSKEALSNSSDNIKNPHSDAKINTQVIQKVSGVLNNKNNNTKQDIATNTEGVKRVLENTVNVTNVGNKTGVVLKTSVPSTATPERLASCSKLSEFNMVRLSPAQHSRRRELINQLEQSIAKGDERSAADAAMKLAQLKLSCAVLSFSSQIAAETRGNVTKKIQESVPEPSLSKLNVPSNIISVKNINLPPNEDMAIKNPTHTEKKYDKECKTDLEKKSPTPLSGPSASSQLEDNNFMVTIEVWVEDREATRGPVRLAVPRQASLGELRRRAARRLGVAARLQRWVVGRELCQDDSAPLLSLAGPRFAEPFYLCLVESEATGASSSQVLAERTSEIIENIKNTSEDKNIPPQRDKPGNVYSELMQLEQRALVANIEPFQCVICLEDCGSGEGAVLRECVHTFCRECLTEVVKHCEEPAVACPALGCPGALQEREIRALISPEDYEKWLARGLATAESGTRNSFHCRTRDCTGWALCDPGVLQFPCPVCKITNCVPCQAIHEGKNCEQHRKDLEKAAETSNASQTDEGTRALLDTLINKGEALECPECSAIITKKWGCDWVKCSACKTEICWVTRGRRWGPAGRGDTSAGCRCGVDGKRCHPSCAYCH